MSVAPAAPHRPPRGRPVVDVDRDLRPVAGPTYPLADGDDARFARDYPEPLRTSLADNGEFTFKSLPPGTPLEVHVVTTRRNPLDLPPGIIFVRKTIGALSPAERYSLPAISVP
jgi:hypothetical protein